MCHSLVYCITILMKGSRCAQQNITAVRFLVPRHAISRRCEVSCCSEALQVSRHRLRIDGLRQLGIWTKIAEGDIHLASRLNSVLGKQKTMNMPDLVIVLG